MKILSATCIRGNGTDVVICVTSLPNGIFPFTGNQTVRLDLAHGTAEKYMTDNMPTVPLKVVDTSE